MFNTYVYRRVSFIAVDIIISKEEEMFVQKFWWWKQQYHFLSRCGQPSKGHLGPCGERCQAKGAHESLRAAPAPDDPATMSPIKDTREEEPEFAYISCDYCDVTTKNWETEKHRICDTCQSSTVVWDYSQPPRILGICIQCTGISSHSYYGWSLLSHSHHPWLPPLPYPGICQLLPV